MKTCKTCKEQKPITEFYALKSMSDGHFNECKVCVRIRVEERRKRLELSDPEWVERELARQRIKSRKARAEGKVKDRGSQYERNRTTQWRRNHPEKHKAHSILGYAVRDGKLQKLPCVVCGSKDSHGHHDDYSKPLDVIWLCPKHHAERHVLLRQQERASKFKNQQ